MYFCFGLINEEKNRKLVLLPTNTELVQIMYLKSSANLKWTGKFSVLSQDQKFFIPFQVRVLFMCASIVEYQDRAFYISIGIIQIQYLNL